MFENKSGEKFSIITCPLGFSTMVGGWLNYYKIWDFIL